ncbi:hypothetical protein HDU80_010111 [Chytriomyces hyalinus]|nr:hypothetical protein HDU80_010111 [Chytriomyces hyalinus]
MHLQPVLILGVGAILGAVLCIVAAFIVIPDVNDISTTNTIAARVAFGEFLNTNIVIGLFSAAQSALITMSSSLLLSRWSWLAFRTIDTASAPLSTLDIPAKNVLQAMSTVWFNPFSSATGLSVVLFATMLVSSFERVFLLQYVVTGEAVYFGNVTFNVTDTSAFQRARLPLYPLSDSGVASLEYGLLPAAKQAAVRGVTDVVDSPCVQDPVKKGWVCGSRELNATAPLINCPFQDCYQRIDDFADYSVECNAPTEITKAPIGVNGRPVWLQSLLPRPYSASGPNLLGFSWIVTRAYNATVRAPETGFQLNCTFFPAWTRRDETKLAGTVAKTVYRNYNKLDAGRSLNFTADNPKSFLEVPEQYAALPTVVIGYLHIALRESFNGTCNGYYEDKVNPGSCQSLLMSLPLLSKPVLTREDVAGVRAEMDFVSDRILRHAKSLTMEKNNTIACTQCVTKPIVATNRVPVLAIIVGVNVVVIVMGVASILVVYVGGAKDAAVTAVNVLMLSQNKIVRDRIQEMNVDRSLEFANVDGKDKAVDMRAGTP